MKTFIFSTDITPASNRIATGGGIRSKQIIDLFTKQGHEVIVSLPKDSFAVRTQQNLLTQSEKSLLYSVHNQLDLIKENLPDIVVWCWPSMRTVPLSGNYISVVDFNGLQNYEIDKRSILSVTKKLLQSLINIDIVIFGSDEQKMYWDGVFDLLFGNDRVMPMSVIIPLALPQSSNKQIYQLGKPDVHFIGSLLPWQNQYKYLSIFKNSCDTDGLLININAALSTHGQSEELLQSLKSQLNLETNLPKPYNQLCKTINKRGVGFDVSTGNLERSLAFPVRTMTYLSLGVPVILGAQSFLAEKLIEFNAGWVVENPTSSTSYSDCVYQLKNIQNITEKSDGAIKLANYFALKAAKGSTQFFKIIEGVPAASIYKFDGMQDDKKISVAIFTNDMDNMIAIRVRTPFDAMANRGSIDGYTIFRNEEIVYSTYNEPLMVRYNRCWVQRDAYSSEAAVKLFKEYVFDIDDNLLCSPSYRPPFTELSRQRIINWLTHAKIITSTNERCIANLSKYAGHDRFYYKYYQVPNVHCGEINNSLVSKLNGNLEPDGIFWGSSDVLSLKHSRQAVINAINKFSKAKNLTVHFWGPIDKYLEEMIPNIKFHKSVSYSDYQSILAKRRWIGIAPLETIADESTIDFINSKSDVKLVEFSANAIPFVCSAVKPYLESELNIINTCVDNADDLWFEALCRCYDNYSEYSNLVFESSRNRNVRLDATAPWLKALSAGAPSQTVLGAEILNAIKISNNFKCIFEDVPEPIFDESFYLHQYPDVKEVVSNGVMTAREHYARHGKKEGRRTSHFQMDDIERTKNNLMSFINEYSMKMDERNVEINRIINK
jgi:hypothetical protein